MLQPGTLVDGKYKILSKIGQGGMSIVYMAINERANKTWAIKEIRRDGVQDYEVVKQGLIVETDLLKRLNHPNLPSIIDVIEEQDTFLIVMDYIEGKPLSSALREYGAQDQAQVIKWAKQLCDVLGYLHSREPAIIYRDMKPSNVMLRPDGNVTLIDFGIAREFKKDHVADTSCLGTRGYAAPEQYGGQGQTDARTDIYCLGATMYHLLTGHNPSEPPYEMYPIRYWNPALSTGLEEIILKCTQANPDDRFQSCGELMYALDHYWELDNEFRKRQGRRWAAFLSMSALTLALAAGAAGFRAAEVSTTNNSYDGYMAAANTDDPQQSFEYYMQAIKLKPEDAQAYQEVLDNFLADGVFSSEEQDQFRTMMGASSGNDKTNREYLKNGDKEQYAQFCYSASMAYFYYIQNGQKKAAKEWLAELRDSQELLQELGENQQKRVELLYKIAEYEQSLDSLNLAGDSKTSYGDYWYDMDSLTNDRIVEDDNVTTALVMYGEMVNQINNKCREFKNAGITEQEITDKLQDISGWLDGIVKEAIDKADLASQESLRNMSDRIKDTIEIIETQKISTVFHGMSESEEETETSEEGR